MDTTGLVKHVLYSIALILLGMLVFVSFAKSKDDGDLTNSGTKLSTEQSGISLGASENTENTGLTASTIAPPAETFVSCTPIEVMTFTNRVHVKCSAAIA